MIKLKYNEKPDDPKLTVSQKIDGRYPGSDVIWMTMEEWFDKGIEVDEDSEDVPDEIKQFIPGWREKAAEICRTATNADFWPVKTCRVQSVLQRKMLLYRCGDIAWYRESDRS